MDEHVHALILAGGRGSRFWPLSRRHLPKQCIPIVGNETPLKATLSRIAPLVDLANTWVLTGPMMAEEVRKEVPGVNPTHILVEPSARNTAPCIGWGTSRAAGEAGGDTVIVVLPADHHIEEGDVFLAELGKAIGLARRSDAIVTLGIRPDRPETAYGYLEVGQATPCGTGRAVRRFCEKPPKETAETWLREGKHLWNAGIFVFRARVLLKAFEDHLPNSAATLREIAANPELLDELWEGLEATSIDYGVMERANRILTVPVQFGWSDLGDWEAVGLTYPETPGGRGRCKATISIDARDCVVHAPNKVVALIGVEDLVIVDTPDAILVMPRSRAQDAKRVSEELDRSDLDTHT